MLVLTVVMLMLGTLPWIDNWAHIGETRAFDSGGPRPQTQTHDGSPAASPARRVRVWSCRCNCLPPLPHVWQVGQSSQTVRQSCDTVETGPDWLLYTCPPARTQIYVRA